MQTHDLRLSGYHGKPESLVHSRFQLPLGIHKCFITYLIIGVPVDVPIFEVLYTCRRILDCQASPVGHYTIDWASLYLTNRR